MSASTHSHEPTGSKMTITSDVIETGTHTFTASHYHPVGQINSTQFVREDGRSFHRTGVHVHDCPNAEPVAHVRTSTQAGAPEARKYVAVEIDSTTTVFLPFNIAEAVASALAAEAVVA